MNFIADVQFEDINPINFQLNLSQLNNTNISSTSSLSQASKMASNFTTNYNTSSADLINLDLMHQSPNSVTSFTTTSNDFFTQIDSNFTSTASYASSSNTNHRKEGKGINVTFLRNNRQNKHLNNNTHQLNKLNALKEKRSAYSSRYALSLMDLFTSSEINQVLTSRSVDQYPPSSFVPPTNISHVPTCTVSTELSSCKSVSINPDLLIGMVLMHFAVLIII